MESVEELYKLHCEIQSKSKELKELRKTYEGLDEQVNEYMTKENLSKIRLSNGKYLHLKEKKSLGPLNKEYILETLKSFYKEPKAQHNKPDELAERTTETIIDNREVKYKNILKFLNK